MYTRGEMFTCINISIELIVISVLLLLISNGAHQVKTPINGQHARAVLHHNKQMQPSAAEDGRGQELLQQLNAIEGTPVDMIGPRECNKRRSINKELRDLTGKRHSAPGEFGEICRVLFQEHHDNMQRVKQIREKLLHLSVNEVKHISDLIEDLESLKEIPSQNDKKLASTLKSLLQPKGKDSSELQERMQQLERLKKVASAGLNANIVQQATTDQRVKRRLEELDLLIKDLISQGMTLRLDQVDQLWSLYHEMDALLTNEWHGPANLGLFVAYSGTVNGALTLLVRLTDQVQLPSDNKEAKKQHKTLENSGEKRDLISENPMEGESPRETKPETGVRRDLDDFELALEGDNEEEFENVRAKAKTKIKKMMPSERSKSVVRPLERQ